MNAVMRRSVTRVWFTSRALPGPMLDKMAGRVRKGLVDTGNSIRVAKAFSVRSGSQAVAGQMSRVVLGAAHRAGTTVPGSYRRAP